VFLATLIRHSNDPAGLLIWCLVGFCAGIYLFVYGFRLLQRRRLILDTPFSKIRSASIGLVEVSGQTVGPYTMIAPITARLCYYYRTLVWEWKQHGKNKDWVKIAAECMHLPFFLDDNTGRLLIDPRGADLDLHRDFQEEFNGSFFSNHDDAPANVNHFLARHGVMTNNKIKVEEFCIKPKNALFILGTLTENPGLEVTSTPVRDDAASTVTLGNVSLSLRPMFSANNTDGEWTPQSGEFANQINFSKQVIRLSPDSNSPTSAGMTQQQKIAAALVKAGISNPAAWSAAGVSSESSPAVQVLLDSTQALPTGNGQAHDNAFDLHPPVVLMKGTANPTFLISWRSQQEVASSLGWKCTLMIWGGPVLALLSLYVFLSIQHIL
jgi:hypothetical protein